MAFIYVLTLTNTPERALSLSPVNANQLSEENIYVCKFLLLISDVHPVMYSIHLDAADILLQNVNSLFMISKALVLVLSVRYHLPIDHEVVY